MPFPQKQVSSENFELEHPSASDVVAAFAHKAAVAFAERSGEGGAFLGMDLISGENAALRL